MKRVFAALLALSVMAALLSPVSAEGKIDGITVSKGGTDSTVTIDPEESYSGESSLKITNKSFEQANRFLSLTVTVPMEEGAVYEYGFYAKADKAAKQSVMIDWGTRHSLAPLSTSYEWTKFKYQYEHLSSSESAVIRFVFDGTVDGFWIDDLYCHKLENGKAVGDNLVPNSGFEQFSGGAQAVDNNGTLPASAYYDNIADEKYLPIYKLEDVSVDGSYSEWESVNKIVPYEKLIYPAGNGKPADLEVWYKCAYDDENFYFVAETTDDIYNSFAGDTYWSGDCIQLAISSLNETFGTEFGLSVDPASNEPFFTGAKPGKLAVAQNGNKRVYECSFKWEDLFGEKPESLLFSMCAADNDGTDRQYVVQVTGGGIAEGKRNTNFPRLILMESYDTPFMWLDGDSQISTGEDGSYQLHIVNPGDEMTFGVKISELDYEGEITVGAAGYHIENISRSFSEHGEISPEIDCAQAEHAYGMKVTVSPTLETYQPQIDKLNGYIDELERLLNECESLGIPTDYEKMNFTILKRYVPIIESDIENRDTQRFDYLFRVLDNIYTEAKNNLNAYMAGTKAAVPATKLVTGDLELDGNTIWGDTVTAGETERRPVFLVGYGHFEQASSDIGIFSDIGANYIQQEVGPSSTVRKGGPITSWIGGGEKEEKPDASMLVSSEMPYQGKNSLKIVNNTPAEPNVYITAYQSIAAKPEATYEFGCMMKGDGSGAWISANNFDSRTNLPAKAEDWQEVKGEFTTDKSGIITFRIASENVNSGLYLDNFFIREKGSSENLLKNPDLEDESGNPEFMLDVSGFKSILNALKRAEENNVMMSVLLAPHYFPEFVYNNYPETSARTPGTIHFRVDNEKVREVIEIHVKAFLELLKNYKSVSDICLSNEPCYSPVANDYYKPLWTDYLKTEYNNDLNELNRIYGSDYQSFEDVEMPQSPEQTPRNQDYRTFNDKLFAEFHEWMADLVHENLPGIPVHVKLMAGGFSTMSDNNIKHLNYGYNIEEFMEFCDVNGLDGGGNYEGGEFLINEFIETSHLSVYSSYDRHTSLLNAPVYNTEDHMIRDGSENWVDEQAQHVGRHIWQGAVHGRGASAIWVWATSYTNETLRGSILYRPDCILEAGRSAMDLNRLSYEVSALQDTDRDIGILYSYMNQNYNYIYNDSSFSVYSGLVYNGMLPLFVSERQLDRMQDVKILFVPYVTNAYEETIDAINKYLDEGGKVIILGDDSLKLDDKNQPHDEDKIKNIYERSVCLAIETDTGNRRMTSPDLYELTDYIHSVLEENNMDIVRLVDAKTGLPPRNVEWISAYYNGKLLVNVCNFGDYDDVKNLNVYVRGEKVGTMQELRFNQMIDTTVAVDPGKPLLLQIDTDTAFMDTYRHWAEESITSLENMGIVSGITQTKFCPEKSLTRAEWTALLMRAAGKSGSSDNSISDAEGHWAQAEINAAYRLGILDGMVTDGYFEPDKEITRDEMAGMLYNTLTKVMGKTLSENGEFHFADEDKLVNKAAVKAIAASGLVSGYPDNTFKGNRSLTRAEAAAVLKRMIDL